MANKRRPIIWGKRRPRCSSIFYFQSSYIGENVDPDVAPSSAASLLSSVYGLSGFGVGYVSEKEKVGGRG